MAAKEEKSKPTGDEQQEKHNQKAKENAAESRAKTKKDGEAKQVEDDQKAKHNQKAKETAAESRTESKGKKNDAAKGSKADTAPANKSDHKSDADAEIDEAQELDGLLAIFSEHEITEIDMDVAAGMIDEWYDILHKSKDESHKEVAANLKQLKKLLSGKKDQSQEVVELLDELGGQTDGLANEAQRGYKGKLHKLGKALQHAAQAIDESIDSDDEDLDEEMAEEEEV